MHTPEQHFSNTPLHDFLLEFSTSASIIGCLIIIVTYFMYKDIRTPSRHIILCISIADFVAAVVNFLVKFADMPDNEIELNLCIIQSYVSSIATLCSFFWTVALSVFLNILIVQKDALFADWLMYRFFHPICWLIPVIINLFALFYHKLGNSYDFVASGWCWIQLELNETTGMVENRNNAIIWMTINYKGFEILTYFILAFLYLRIKCHLKDKIKTFEDNDRKLSTFVSPKSIQAAKTTDRKLIFIPVMLILLRIWGTVRFILFIIRSGSEDMVHREMSLTDKVLLCFQTVGDNGIGAVNCILFCFLTPKVRNHLKTSMFNLKSKCCCFNKRVSSESLLEDEADEKTKLISQTM